MKKGVIRQSSRCESPRVFMGAWHSHRSVALILIDLDEAANLNFGRMGTGC